MFYAVIKMTAVHLLFRTNDVECHLKDMGEVAKTNWTHVLKAVEDRIVGGTATNLSEFPFLVQFYNCGGLCGGTILTSKTVLTAAHCFGANTNLEEMKIFSRNLNKIYIKVKVNRLNIVMFTIVIGLTNDTFDGPRFTFDINAHIHEVWKFVIHEHYNMKYFFANDIAVIIIHDTFVFGPQVQKATLVDSDAWMNENEEFIASGWGEIEYGEGIKTRGLRKVHLHYISKERCEAQNKLEISPDMFCLHGDGNRDTCRGDSGGGILWKGAIVGIISHGRGCAQLPGMYVKVNYFHSWIRKTVIDLHKAFCDFH